MVIAGWLEKGALIWQEITGTTLFTMPASLFTFISSESGGEQYIEKTIIVLCIFQLPYKRFGLILQRYNGVYPSKRHYRKGGNPDKGKWIPDKTIRA
jgi:hypothetical protein